MCPQAQLPQVKMEYYAYTGPKSINPLFLKSQANGSDLCETVTKLTKYICSSAKNAVFNETKRKISVNFN